MRYICRSQSLRSNLLFIPMNRLIAAHGISRGRARASSTELSSNMAKPSEEIRNVEEMDRLLELVRERSNPAFRSTVPMRSPQLWAESLISKQPKQPTAVSPAAPINEKLPGRPMHHSYSQFVLPFASDSTIFEQYTNVHGGIRVGKLMEDLDALAGGVAYKHLLETGVSKLTGSIDDRGFYIVTASVERLDMLSPLTPEKIRDLRLSGQVIYTGKSSMEVVVKMEALGPNDAEETIMLGRFTMVCLSAGTHKARPVNPLILSSDDEKALFKMGEALSTRRKTSATQSLSQTPPTSEEAAKLHSTYLKYRPGEKRLDGIEAVPMSEAGMESTVHMFPQQRNIHSKVFGGYLMRLAYELGYSNANVFTRGVLRFLSLDEITFKHPVPIGSVLRLRSRIAHTTTTSPNVVHVAVQANVIDTATGEEQTTNEFRFTWGCYGRPFTRMVIPQSYEEAMLWLEASRAISIGTEIREGRSAS